MTTLSRKLIVLITFVLMGQGFGDVPPKTAEWRHFRGPDGQGVSEAKGLPISWSGSENILWKRPLPGPNGSSPIVFGKQIYVTSYNGYAGSGSPDADLSSLKRHILCLNRVDGKVIWQKDIPADLPEQPKVREHEYASNTPLADSERLYVFFGKSGVLAFSHDGKQLWHADVGSKIHGWGSAASPVLYKDFVIINASVESASLVALNKQTNKKVWRAERIKDS